MGSLYTDLRAMSSNIYKKGTIIFA